MDKINRPRGTKDVTPKETGRWRALESIAASTALDFGFGEIRFPAFEHTELFVRGVGETTDVVQKEMYTFNDKGGRSITLRPEGTASAVRAAIENGLINETAQLKMFYIAPMFRYEAPQSGRLREHHQFGAEIFGAAGAEGDLEIIMLAHTFLSEVLNGEPDGAPGAPRITLNINSIGCADCRAAYREALLNYLRGRDVCRLCGERMERNPLRALDCKDEDCRAAVKHAPLMTDFLCADCSANFSSIKTGLSQLGIEYTVNERMVRGLDYYNGLVFEFIHGGLTVLGGGRYDGLTEQLGGPATPACGFGCGLERVLAVCESAGISHGEDAAPWFYIAVADAPDSPAGVTARALTRALRKQFRAERDICGRSLKAQLRHADRLGAKFLIIIGGNEVEKGAVEIKRMADGEWFESALDSQKIIDICT